MVPPGTSMRRAGSGSMWSWARRRRGWPCSCRARPRLSKRASSRGARPARLASSALQQGQQPLAPRCLRSLGLQSARSRAQRRLRMGSKRLQRRRASQMRVNMMPSLAHSFSQASSTPHSGTTWAVMHMRAHERAAARRSAAAAAMQTRCHRQRASRASPLKGTSEIQSCTQRLRGRGVSHWQVKHTCIIGLCS